MEERTNSTLLKRILLGAMIIVLVLPMLQHKFKFFKVKPLNGAVEFVERPAFSSADWFEGTYQDKRTDYLNQNVGFRNGMVRTYNQWHFSFYNQARAKGVVIGKENYLYEENYIRAYFGEDFNGVDKIQEQVKKLKLVSDTLEKIGKHLVVLLAPGKASFYPEFIPRKSTLPMGIAPRTNYDVYSSELKKDVKTLDLNLWFRENKGKMPYPLYPKTGIHWSKYGEIVMADTLIKFFNNLSGVQLPALVVDSIQRKTEMWDTDDDIEKGMNLLFNIPDNKMGYPRFRVVKDDEKYSKVLTIADSYFWGPFNGGMSRDLFDDGRFWYYNEVIYPDSYESPLNVKDIDFQKKLEENDVILIICTDANLYKFGFGFIEQAYDAYFK